MLDQQDQKLLFTGGTIFTGSQNVASVEVHNGVVTAIDIDASEAHTVINLEGAFLSASFGDGHAHPMFAGFEFFGPEIRNVPTLAGVLEAVKEFADAHPELPWILGGSYDSWLVENGEFDARWLDQVVPDRPVVLRATDYHTIWCNTKAIEAAGITSETPNPELGWILRRPDGSLMGTFREWDAVDLILEHAPGFSLQQKVDALELASNKLSASGITWVQDAWVDPGMPEAYLEAERLNKLSARFNLAMRADARTWRSQLEWFKATRDLFQDSKMVTCRTIKLFADGVIEGHTAAIKDGYTDQPENRGMPCWDWSELRECVAAVDALGFQVHIHAIGDEGLTESLNAIEFAQQKNGDKSHSRPVITHVQLLNPSDISRFLQLNVVANFEPLWACNDSLQRDLTTPHVGHERASWQYPMKSVLDAGAVISMGSDWPVTDYDPLACMQIAITRVAEDDPAQEVWIPSERLTPLEALRAYTFGVAYQAMEDSLWGAIEVGKRADFVILDKNPLEVEHSQINTLSVLATWLGGKKVFDQTV